MKPMQLAFLIFLFAFAANAHTIKTNHGDVNLWPEPGRLGGSTIGEVKKFEEVQVLQTKTLPNGKKWYRVELRRLPGWRQTTIKGWVDAQFFANVAVPVSDDQPTEAQGSEACLKCSATKTATHKAVKNLRDLDEISSKVEKQIHVKKNRPNSFLWPTKSVIVRSGFGMRRHPITGMVKLHSGTDIAGGNMNSVHATKAGKILRSVAGCLPGRKSCNGGAGNFVVIDHGDGTQSKYLHLNQNCALARSGSRVELGQKIGCVGTTGASTGPHLHFSILKRGKFINPLTVFPRRTI